MPVRTDIQPIDIQDFLRKRRLEDIMKVPEIQDDAVGDNQLGIQSNAQTPPVQTPASPPTQLDSTNQQSTQDLRKIIAGQPQKSDYHPSLLRKIAGIAAGIGTGVAYGVPQAGENVYDKIAYAPFNKNMSDYRQKLQRAGSLAGIDTSIREQQLKDESERAKAGHLRSQGEAEVARKGAEEARRLKEVQQTKILPPDYETAHRGKLEELETSHPDKYTIHVDQDSGVATTMDTKTGEVTFKKYDDKAKIDKELSGTLKELAKSHKILGDPNESPTNKTAAQQFIKHFQESSQQKPPQVMMISPEGQAMNIKPGMTVPQGSQTAAGINASNTDTSSTRTMRESAPKVIGLVDKIAAQVDQQAKNLGPAASRWSEFMAGKVGAPNPEFTTLRTDTGLLQTLLMRMHVGARGGQQMMQHFKDLINTSKQSPENLKAALGAIRDYAQTVAAHGEAGPSEGIAKIPRNANETDEQYFMRVARGGK